MQPKVSVIIPVYGVEKYIERCARSLFEQTLDDIEYIFIDDCTPDDSIKVLNCVLDYYPNRKPQVVIHRMEKNSGQAKVREWGMRNATGDFVIHCDSDDWVEKDMYQIMYEKAIQENADYVICDYSLNDEFKILRTVRGCYTTRKEDLIDDLICLRCAVSLWNKLIKRSVIEKGLLTTKYNVGEDFLQTIHFLLNSKNVAYVAQRFYNYYINSNSITNTVDSGKKLKNVCHNKANLDLLIDIFKQKGLYKQYESSFIVAKWHIKEKLEFTLSSQLGYAEWYKTYPEIHKQILFNHNLTIKSKVKFILIYLRLYPLLRKNRNDIYK